MRVVIALSGQMYSGKTSLAAALVRRASFVHVSARELLSRLCGETAPTRDTLQSFGAQLELETAGKWIGESLAGPSLSAADRVVIDSLRSPAQHECLAGIVGVGYRLIHLQADEGERRRRFESGGNKSSDHGTDLNRAMSHPSELEVEGLRSSADLVIATTSRSMLEVENLALQWISAVAFRSQNGRRNAD